VTALSERRLAPLIKAGYLEVDTTHLRATPAGRQRLNAVLERLVA
jgi:coproporphyrinogen III oxidase-like Fe-S oxidoreductase